MRGLAPGRNGGWIGNLDDRPCLDHRRIAAFRVQKEQKAVERITTDPGKMKLQLGSPEVQIPPGTIDKRAQVEGPVDPAVPTNPSLRPQQLIHVQLAGLHIRRNAE